MFRKIHSNRHPKDTILSQLKAEFYPYVEKTSGFITQQLKRNPKLIFTAMVLLLVFSAWLSFTLFRNPERAEKKKTISKDKMDVIGDGFGQIRTTAAAIGQTIRLKQQIDSLSSKKTLSKRDSNILENDLDQLRRLNQNSKP
jgi:hypothetical protein